MFYPLCDGSGLVSRTVRMIQIVLIALLLIMLVLLTWRTAQARLSDADRAIYSEAFKEAHHNRWQKALRQAQKGYDPLPYKILQWMYYSQTNSGAVFESIASFLHNHTHWPWHRKLRLRAEAAMDQENLSEAEILGWFMAYPPLSAKGITLYTKALQRVGRHTEATELVRQFWVSGNFGAREEKDFLKLFRASLRQKDHIKRLDRLLWTDVPYAAQRMLPLVHKNQRLLAEARIKLMRQSAGVDAAIKRVPASLHKDAGLQFERLRWRRRRGLVDSAFEILQNPPDDLGDPEAWWPERSYLIRKALYRGEIALAYQFSADHRMKKGVGFAASEFLAGWIAIRFLKKYQLGYTHFVQLYHGVSYPVSLARASYWAGEAAVAMGDQQLAKSWYETAAQFTTTYYGQLAASRLGLESISSTPKGPQPNSTETRFFQQSELVQVMECLADLEKWRQIDPFFNKLSKHVKQAGHYVLLARTAESVERPDLALRAAKIANRKGVTLMDYSYPVTTLPDMSEEIGAELILAVIRQESAYNHRAVSPAGALGLMQLMPGTAKLVAKNVGIAYSKARLTKDKLYNISLGSQYLRQLLEKYQGSYIMALAAYNAGPGRVSRWIKQFGHPHKQGGDPVDWVELIPFNETRNYVQRVMESMQIYRYRLSGARVALSLDQDLLR